ncbi:unnamed protein product [Clavelina lepadiformis]|uniref:Serine/threonine-protein kinase PLK4 n=1 Tax=Clavelina lepadiformis TaxID=159417 RepID=A0ABP0H0G8_CLALP
MPHKIAKMCSTAPNFGGSIADYEVLNLIGRGAFACVYRAKCRRSGRDIAIKMIDKRSMRKSGMVSRVRSEVEIHAQLKHPSVLELFHCFEDSDHVYLVVELCLKGELNRFLKTQGNVLSENQVREFLTQIVEGMLYLHAHGILHRDLTLANMLLDDTCHIKIADFGLATRLALPTDKHFTMCGTPNFISPEIATRSAHGLESDVWSLGCMLYTFLVGTPPFDTDAVKSTLNKVVLGSYKIPEHVSNEARDLIQDMLQKDPRERITLSAVLEHPFMRPETWKGAHRERSVDSGHATMTTNSTNNYSRQGTLHNTCHQQSVNGSTNTADTAVSRLPPRTRPVVALPPSKLETVPDVDPGTSFNDTYNRKADHRADNAHVKDRSKMCKVNSMDYKDENDGLWASRTQDMPGNRPPMWRQNIADNTGHSRRHHSSREEKRQKDRSKSSSSRHRGDSPAEVSTLLPSKPSFRNSRHEYHASTHKRRDQGGSYIRSGRNPYNSIDSDSTGSSRPYGTRYTASTDSTGCDDTHYSSRYPDASTMRPDDLFYPPGGSFQPYEAKYEPGCYKSSSHSTSNRPRHPPSPPVRDVPPPSRTCKENWVEDLEQRHNRYLDKEHYRCDERLDRNHPENGINRSSSMQNISQCEPVDSSNYGSNRRLSRSASSHRTKHLQEKPPHSRSKPSADRTYDSGSSKQSSCYNDPYAAEQSRGRSLLRTKGESKTFSSTHSQVSDSQYQNCHPSETFSKSSKFDDKDHRKKIDSNNSKSAHRTTESLVQSNGHKQPSHAHSRPVDKSHHSNSSSQSKAKNLPSIDSRRLRPIRQKAKNSMVSILENGEVCLEIISSKSGSDAVTEVLRVSGNGKTIKIFSPEGKDGKNGYVLSRRPPVAPDNACIYSYTNLPDKYCNKYKYLARFVQLVRSKTPKVTLFTNTAKCMLMENDPDADLEVCFYNGAKIQQIKGKTQIIDISGKLVTLSSKVLSQARLQDNLSPQELEKLTPEILKMLEHAQSARQRSMDIESSISVVEENSDGTVSYFPITVSRRPNSSSSSSSTSSSKASSKETSNANQENNNNNAYQTPTRNDVGQSCRSPRTPDSLPSPSIAPTTSPSTAPPIRFTESVLSFRSNATAMSRSKSVVTATRKLESSSSLKRDPKNVAKLEPLADQQKIAKAVEVPGIGRASHLTTGDIWVVYNDKSQILVQSSTTSVVYADPDGVQEKFGQSARLPDYVKAKLSELPSIVEMLVKVSKECSSTVHTRT